MGLGPAGDGREDVQVLRAGHQAGRLGDTGGCFELVARQHPRLPVGGGRYSLAIRQC